MKKLKMIVGLGNPGENYDYSPHNFGFLAIDLLAKELKIELDKKNNFGVYHAGEGFILLKPLTFVNLSGEAIEYFIEKFKVSKQNFLILYDDINLPLGSLKLREKGSHGGHNGIKNIIFHLKTEEFKRIKIGAKNNHGISLNNWVTKKVNIEEQNTVLFSLNNLAILLSHWITNQRGEKIENYWSQKSKFFL